MTLCIGRFLGGLHNRVARRLMRRQSDIEWYGVWVYLLLEDAMVEAVLQEVGTYAFRCHNTVAQFIANRPIMDLYLAADRRPGSRVAKPWW